MTNGASFSSVARVVILCCSAKHGDMTETKFALKAMIDSILHQDMDLLPQVAISTIVEAL